MPATPAHDEKAIETPAVHFFPPTLPSDDFFDREYFAEENSAVLMPGHKTKFSSLSNVLNDPGCPVLAFTARLHQEIRYLASSIPTEWAVFLLLKKLSTAQPHFLAYDWFMTKQRASSGEVTMDADDARRYYRVLEEAGYYKQHGLQPLLAHLHSHAQMGVFFSTIDDNQQVKRDELGFYGDYRFYVVVNAEGEIKVRFVTYSPVLGTWEAVPALLFSKPAYVGELTERRKREIDARVAALVDTRNTFRPQWHENNGGKAAQRSARKKDALASLDEPLPSEPGKSTSLVSAEDRKRLLQHLFQHTCDVESKETACSLRENADEDGRCAGSLAGELFDSALPGEPSGEVRETGSREEAPF